MKDYKMQYCLFIIKMICLADAFFSLKKEF